MSFITPSRKLWPCISIISHARRQVNSSPDFLQSSSSMLEIEPVSLRAAIIRSLSFNFFHIPNSEVVCPRASSRVYPKIFSKPWFNSLICPVLRDVNVIELGLEWNALENFSSDFFRASSTFFRSVISLTTPKICFGSPLAKR